MERRSTEGEPRAPQHNSEQLASPPPRKYSVWMSPRLDFRRAVPLRKSYIVASSYRCGSTFFCSQLWKTGVLGAPAEYLNVGAGRMSRDIMMRRLHVNSPENYFAKLLACRTSMNGVFGLKVHFPHFEVAMSWYPSMLRVLSPVTYIYLNRKDKLAQAVSMAKAIQTDAWQSLDNKVSTTLIYDEALIASCLSDVRQQGLGWLRWFELNNITPFVVHYEDLVANTANVISSVVELLGVVKDYEPEEIWLPVVEKQGDEVNLDWQDRFLRTVPDWESRFPLPDL
jgi:LPS sulfotransferase NodH